MATRWCGDRARKLRVHIFTAHGKSREQVRSRRVYTFSSLSPSGIFPLARLLKVP